MCGAAAPRFTKAAFKALNQKQRSQPDLPVSTTTTTDTVDYFFVNVEYALVKVIISEITHVEGMKDYVKIHLETAKRPVITKYTLKGIEEEKLPARQFMRVHKSFIVNVDKVESIRNHQITIGNCEIPVSESQMEGLLRRLNHLK